MHTLRNTSGRAAVVQGGSTAISGTTAPLPYYYRIAENGNRDEHGSGTVVGGGSAAQSGTTALLPLNYRLTENDTRRKTQAVVPMALDRRSTAQAVLPLPRAVLPVES